MLAEKLQGAVGNASNPVYVDDVFSTYLYKGVNGAQTINNGIDVTGKGGMVWLKCRSNPQAHGIFDTARGDAYYLSSNLTNAQADAPDNGISFTSTGYNIDAASYFGGTGDQSYSTFASWTFRKQPKFFDVVTWTGDGVNPRTISHSLGSAPGCIITKRTDTTGNWLTYHRGLNGGVNPEQYYILLNTTDGQFADIGAFTWASTAPTSSSFTVGRNLNQSGGTYVAYLFAHDAGGFGTSGTDNVISCGSFTTDGSGNATVSLGYEPQWVLYKGADLGGSNWTTVDTMRGFTTSGADSALYPNTSAAESNLNSLAINSTGFSTKANLTANTTYIYIAIRRPMKPPTTGTSVFSPTVYDGNTLSNRLVNTGIVTDATFVRNTNNTITGSFRNASRLIGNPYLQSASTAAEVTSATTAFMTPTSGVGNSFSAMNGFGVGSNDTAYLNNSAPNIAYAFKRASGFFDEVCYTGNASSQTINHNLTVIPELVIFKIRSSTSSWWTTYSFASDYKRMALDLTNAESTISYGGVSEMTAAPTSTTLSLGNTSRVNGSGQTYVAYLFATVAGVSKIGTYTGTGDLQQIACGFSAAGARFVMIKRTDSTGNWYVFDSAEGFDGYSLLNTIGARVTGVNYCYQNDGGFGLYAAGSTTININGASYIYLAIA